MKRIILTLLAIVTLTFESQASWFNKGEQKEKERREHAEQQVAQAQHRNDGLGVVVLVLAVGVVTALIIGAAVGSATRRAAKTS